MSGAALHPMTLPPAAASNDALASLVAAENCAGAVSKALLAGDDPLRLGYATLCALFLVFTHRANIARLRAGTESRFERVRVFARLRARMARR